MSIFDGYEDKSPEELAKKLGISDLSVIDNAGTNIIQTLDNSQKTRYNNIFILPSRNIELEDNDIKNIIYWKFDYNIKQLAVGMLCKKGEKLVRITYIDKNHIIVCDEREEEIIIPFGDFEKEYSLYIFDFNQVCNFERLEKFVKYPVLWEDFHGDNITEGTIMKEKTKKELLIVDTVFIDNVFTDRDDKGYEYVTFQNNPHTYDDDTLKKSFSTINEYFIEKIGLLPKDIIDDDNWHNMYEPKNLEIGVRVMGDNFLNPKLFEKGMIHLGKVKIIKENIIQIEWDNNMVETYTPNDMEKLGISVFHKDIEEPDFDTSDKDVNKYFKRSKRIDIKDIRRGMRVKKNGSNISRKIGNVDIEIGQIQTIGTTGIIESFDIQIFLKCHQIYKEDLQLAKEDTGYIGLTQDNIESDGYWEISRDIQELTLGTRIKVDGKLGKITDIIYDPIDSERYKVIKIKWSNNTSEYSLVEGLSKQEIHVYKSDTLEISETLEEWDIEEYWEEDFDIYDIKRGYILKSKTDNSCFSVIDIENDMIKSIDLKSKEIYENNYCGILNDALIYKKSININYSVAVFQDDVPF